VGNRRTLSYVVKLSAGVLSIHGLSSTCIEAVTSVTEQGCVWYVCRIGRPDACCLTRVEFNSFLPMSKHSRPWASLWWIEWQFYPHLK